MRIAHWCLAALFAFAAAVQYNDPDPARWMAIYLAAAAFCVAAARPLAGSAAVRSAAALVGALALLGAAGIWAGVDHPLVPWRMFDQWEMKDLAVEETREIFGLLIVVAWMALVGLAGVRR